MKQLPRLRKMAPHVANAKEWQNGKRIHQAPCAVGHTKQQQRQTCKDHAHTPLSASTADTVIDVTGIKSANRVGPNKR